jgi:hypothetical protein
MAIQCRLRAGFTPVQFLGLDLQPSDRGSHQRKTQNHARWRQSGNGLRTVPTMTILLRCPRADPDRLRRCSVPAGRLERCHPPHCLAAARARLLPRGRPALRRSGSLGGTGRSFILAHSITSLPSTAVVAIGTFDRRPSRGSTQVAAAVICDHRTRPGILSDRRQPKPGLWRRKLGRKLTKRRHTLVFRPRSRTIPRGSLRF